MQEQDAWWKGGKFKTIFFFWGGGVKYNNSNQLVEFIDEESRETSAMYRHKN